VADQVVIPSPISSKEVSDFSDRWAHIRSACQITTRIWGDSAMNDGPFGDFHTIFQ